MVIVFILIEAAFVFWLVRKQLRTIDRMLQEIIDLQQLLEVAREEKEDAIKLMDLMGTIIRKDMGNNKTEDVAND